MMSYGQLFVAISMKLLLFNLLISHCYSQRPHSLQSEPLQENPPDVVLSHGKFQHILQCLCMSSILTIAPSSMITTYALLIQPLARS